MNSKNHFFGKTIIVCVLMFGVLSTSAQQWWQQTSGSTRNLQNINFYDDNTGLAFADTLSKVLKTTDQGVGWSPSNPTFLTANLRSSAFLSSATIITVGRNTAVSGGVVLKSTNTGITWSDDTSFPEDLNDIMFIGPTQGWICGMNGYAGRSLDGGNVWASLPTGTSEHLYSIHFIASTGWAVGAAGTIIPSFNSGSSWMLPQTSNVSVVLRSVFFLDAQSGWVVGDNGTVISTTNGGTSWITQISTVNQDLFDVQFIDVNNGWAVGAGGIVIKTTNGGTTWATETTPTSEDLHSLSMRNTGLGWACGDNGAIIIYAVSSPGFDESQLEAGIIVYPNPVSEQLKIACGNCDNDWAFSLFDLNGKLLIQQDGITDSEVSISMKNLSVGTYMLEVRSGKGLIDTRKVVFE